MNLKRKQVCHLLKIWHYSYAQSLLFDRSTLFAMVTFHELANHSKEEF